MHGIRAAIAALVALVFLVVTAGAGFAGPKASDIDRSSALVELRGAPLTTAVAATASGRVDLQSRAAFKHRARLALIRGAYEQWLRVHAPEARVTSAYDTAVHAVAVDLNGASIDLVRSAPQALRAHYQALFTPQAHEDPDLALISALEAWESMSPTAPEQAGEGVKIAIIDSGIDVSHPCFSDEGYPEGNSLAPDNAVNGGTNDKVIYAAVFGNKVAKDGLDASDENGHGTHVAGTAACNAHTPAWIDDLATGSPVEIPYGPSGVAPGAMLGNFNVFPGTAGSARSEDILNGLQRAFE